MNNDAFCLWLSNRRSLTVIGNTRLDRRRCQIIEIFGGILILINKACKCINQEGIKDTNHQIITSISTFKEILWVVLSKPANLTTIQHQRLYDILNYPTCSPTNQSETKINTIEINNNYLNSSIYRINNNLLCKIFEFVEYEQFAILPHISVSWCITSRSMLLCGDIWTIDKWQLNLYHSLSKQHIKIIQHLSNTYNLFNRITYNIPSSMNIIFCLQIFHKLLINHPSHTFDIKLILNYLETILYTKNNYHVTKYSLSVLNTICQSKSFLPLVSYQNQLLKILLIKIRKLDSSLHLIGLNIIHHIMSLSKPNKPLIKNILYNFKKQLMKYPNYRWRKKLKVNDEVIFLDQFYKYKTAKVINTDPYTDYIQIHIHGKGKLFDDEWILRYSSRLQNKHLNPNIYIKHLSLFTNIISTPVLCSNQCVEIIRIINQLKILEIKQHKIFRNSNNLFNKNRDHLISLFNQINKKVLIPAQAYFLCIYLICLLSCMKGKLTQKLHIFLIGSLKNAFIQGNHVNSLFKLDEYISHHNLSVSEINKIDSVLNKLMMKKKLLIIITPYIFGEVYGQILASKYRTSTKEKMKKEIIKRTINNPVQALPSLIVVSCFIAVNILGKNCCIHNNTEKIIKDLMNFTDYTIH